MAPGSGKNRSSTLFRQGRMSSTWKRRMANPMHTGAWEWRRGGRWAGGWVDKLGSSADCAGDSIASMMPHAQDHGMTSGEQRPLILLPGLDGAGLAFGPMIKLLPSSIRPTVVSYPRDRVMGYPELMPWVMGKLPGEPFVLLGESFSSPLAIMIAAARPRGLRGLILSSAFARNPLWLAPNWLASLARPLPFQLYKPYVRVKAWWRGGEARVARLEAMSGLIAAVVAHRAQSALRVNVMDLLSTCDVPVLYVRG